MKERVTIARRPLKDGVVSLFLDYRIGGKRRRDNLKLYLVPETYASDKAKNAETMRIAKARRDEREFELEQAEAGISVKARPTIVPFSAVADTLIARNGVSRNTTMGLVYVRNMVDKMYPGISVQECDSKWFTKAVSKMVDSGFKMNTVHSYATLIRQVIRRAYADGIITALPYMEMPRKEKSIRIYLTFDELEKLESTPFREDVKVPFLFCCFTGLRISDCKALKPSMIVGSEIVLRQQKTNDVVRIPLTGNALRYLPSPGVDGRYFHFPYGTDIIRQMNAWARKAGIDKHLSFHVARHTFATLLITSGADVYTTSRLLGHASVATTQIYAKVVDEVRRKAVDLIPKMK